MRSSSSTRSTARTRGRSEVVNEIFDLFIELGASDEQAEFPVLYTNAKAGTATRATSRSREPILEPLFEAIARHVPEAPAEDGRSRCSSAQSTTTSTSDASASAASSAAARGQRADREGRARRRGRDRPPLDETAPFAGLERIEIEEATAGDIVCVSGIEGINIGDTLADAADPEAIHAVAVDEPTVAMFFSVNTSPFAGREGKF